MVDNKLGIARINQEGERLFTVRPRYYATDPKNPKRGEAATIRLILSDKSLDVNQLAQTMPYYEGVAFKRLMNEDDEMGGYKDFIVTDVQYEIAEKHQVFQTFGGSEAVYFYGRSPMALRISGLVMDDLDNDQFARFAQLYMNHIRGTQAARNYALIEISLPNATFFGSITSLTFGQNSARDTDVQFSLSFLVKEVIFRSTDVYFEDSSGAVKDFQNENFLGSRNPTRSAMEISDGRLSSGKTWVDGEGNIWNPVFGNIEKYTQAIASIPSIQDLLGIGFDEIWSILNDWNNALSEILAPIEAVVNRVNDYADEITGYLSTVERGLDQMMDNITGAVGGVLGAVNTIEDTVGRVVNFPQTLASKVGGFISGGFMDPFGATGAVIKGGGGAGGSGAGLPGGGGGGSEESAALVGSTALGADDSAAILKAGALSDPGPSRGSEMDPPPIDVAKNSDEFATLPSGV